ncbi:YSIRK-type signal peptide-containing protein [Streptococcus iniae]
MNKNSKKLFEKRQRFSIRRLSIGVGSVLIGICLFGTPLVSAEELRPTQPRTCNQFCYRFKSGISSKGE